VDDRYGDALIFPQQVDQFGGRQRRCELGKAAQVDEHRRRFELLAVARMEQFVGTRKPLGDFGGEKTRKLRNGGLVFNRMEKQLPRAGDRHGKHQSDDHDRHHAVNFSADQNLRRRYVFDVVVRHQRRPARLREGVPEQRQPARRRGKPGEQDVARRDGQGAQNDEYENVEQRGRLQIERRRLAVLDVEAPDRDHQHRHVHQYGRDF